MTRVLVTGASGFVGGAVVRHLLTRPGIAVVASCRHASDQLRELAAQHPQLHVASGIDLSDRDAVNLHSDGITHVIHVAALARFEGATRAELDRANVQATANLLDWARDQREPLKRFLYVSTFGVHDRPWLTRSAEPIRETSPFASSSEYGRSKRRAERLVRTSGLPHVVARLSWIYGPSMNAHSHIRVLAGMCRQGSLVTRFDLPGRVSVAHVDDAAAALSTLAQKPSLTEDTYLIAHEQPVSFGEMFHLFRELAMPGKGAMTPLGGLVPLARAFTPLMPMKLRSLLEDYYVCSPAHLAAEGAALTTPWPIGLKDSVMTGRWFA